MGIGRNGGKWEERALLDVFRGWDDDTGCALWLSRHVRVSPRFFFMSGDALPNDLVEFPTLSPRRRLAQQLKQTLFRVSEKHAPPLSANAPRIS